MGSKIAAFLTKFSDWYLILILALFTVLFFDFPFDWQTMTIPARHIICVFTKHGLRTVNHIFQNLIERMTNMKLAISIGRAVMQHEFRRIFALCTQFFIQIQLFPMRHNFRLFFGQATTHWKFSFRKKYGLFIIHHSISAHSRFGLSCCRATAPLLFCLFICVYRSIF